MHDTPCYEVGFFRIAPGVTVATEGNHWLHDLPNGAVGRFQSSMHFECLDRATACAKLACEDDECDVARVTGLGFDEWFGD